MSIQTNIITGAVERIRTGLVASMQSYDRIGTGRTMEETITVPTADGAQLQAPYYIDDLENGRPGSGVPPKNRPPGDLERIKEWCIAKGLDPGAAYGIKNKVDKDGYEGSPGVISQPLSDQVVDPIINEALNKVALIVTKQVAEEIRV